MAAYRTRYPNRSQKQQYTPEETVAYAKKQIDENRQRLSNSEEAVARLGQALTQVEREYHRLEAKLAGRGFFDLTFGEGASIKRQVSEVGHKVWQTRQNLESAENQTERYREAIKRYESMANAMQVKIDLQKRSEERQRAKAEVERRREEKRQAERAVAARAQRQDRAVAASLRRQLERDHDCPYCGEPLNEDAQLDHIFPVACGGLSVKGNLVFVCSDCNSHKRDRTLNEFIERNNFDREEIFRRLKRLGKRF